MKILTSAEAAALVANDEGRISAVKLKDGSELTADLFVACTGIRPNIALAEACGLDTGRGIRVDERMQTSIPGIYAAGDVAEHEGHIHGLWPVAIAQAEVAAANALGEERRFAGFVPTTLLKVSGIDLLSAGRIAAETADDCEIVDQPSAERYRKLVISGGRLVGAILIGYPADAARTAQLVRHGADLAAMLPALRRGDWSVLEAEVLPLAA